MAPMSAVFETEHSALMQGAGMVDFSSRTQIEFVGADRATFLHNLCTNVVRDLPVGKGSEAFILNVKGHIAGHVYLFVCPNSIVLETMPDQSEKLLAHFDRYLIREDVQLVDRSTAWAEFYLAGSQIGALLSHLGLQPPQERLAHVAGQLSGCQVWLRKVDLTGPSGFLMACPREFLTQIQEALIDAGAIPCGDEAFQAARIEMGTPLFGRDINEENLPQEIDRNRSTISFTKGCYLGQETVARIDALGHVNRLLRGVKFLSDAAIPLAETVLHSGATAGSDAPGKTVGRITSACWSPRLNAPLALALVHRDSADIGTRLQSQIGAAEVASLPLDKRPGE
jgi:tRNA-modifying protein YgfZ